MKNEILNSAISLRSLGLLFVPMNMSGSKMYELVKIGWDKFEREVNKIEGDLA